MATTWNPSDKNASVALSGSNLIATSGSIAQQGVRGVASQLTDKAYWEYAGTTWGSSTGFGIASSAASLSSNATTHALLVFATGAISVTGSQVAALGARASGDIIGMAIDFTARLAWLRVAPAGLWNASAPANPATGTGGLSIAGIGGGTAALFPFAAFAISGNRVTANFGDSAFTGAVPSGFSAGFPTPPVAPTGADVRAIVLA